MASDPTAADAGSLRQQRRASRRTLGRDHLLDAAEQVFAEHGFHEASLREIAERAEYAVGSVYSFFASKDDLYSACLQRRGSQFMAGMRDLLGRDAPAHEQLHALADWQVGFFREHSAFARLVMRSGSFTPPFTTPVENPQIGTNFREAHQLQADLIARGQREGAFRSGEPAVLARVFSGLISALQLAELDTAQRGEPPPSTDLLHALLDGALGRSEALASGE
ncbi:MAG TPA: TetR/AcrR family transcriptional regulator [Mycobacteriales bacterium]|nr:TetR/AcrR family transcriptional regulator [Mycobacteriales bacterium]